MAPSRWFSREGPFVGARYALEIASVQLRRRAARSRQDESKEVGGVGSKRTSSRCNEVHHVWWGELVFRLLSHSASRAARASHARVHTQIQRTCPTDTPTAMALPPTHPSTSTRAAKPQSHAVATWPQASRGAPRGAPPPPPQRGGAQNRAPCGVCFPAARKPGSGCDYTYR
jgi:hypothetical protein